MLKYLLFLTLATSLYSRDYGIHGHTFPIQEQDLIEHIQGKIEDGDMLENLTREKIESLKNPPAVQGLSEAAVYSCKLFDPTIVSNQDILDAEGNIIVSRGTAVNPLDYLPLSDDVLFFDGMNEKHIEWAEKYPDAFWVLVRGSPFELEERLHRPVYYDQSGVLIGKFSIKSIPARISQQGKLLKIEEMPVKTLANCSNNMEQLIIWNSR